MAHPPDPLLSRALARDVARPLRHLPFPRGAGSATRIATPTGGTVRCSEDYGAIEAAVFAVGRLDRRLQQLGAARARQSRGAAARADRSVGATPIRISPAGPQIGFLQRWSAGWTAG
jgi:hypothetical protein